MGKYSSKVWFIRRIDTMSNYQLKKIIKMKYLVLADEVTRQGLVLCQSEFKEVILIENRRGLVVTSLLWLFQ